MAEKKKSNALRNTAGGILLGLLALSLVGFGVDGFGGRTNSLGKVGDRDVRVDDYFRSLQNEMQAMTRQLGQPVTFQQAQLIGLDQQVRSQLVMRAALDNEADRLGISVGDALVSREVLSIPQFQSFDGSFDREAYRFALQSAGMSESEFETSVREDAARGILQTAIVAGMAAPQAHLDALLNHAAEQRRLEVLTLTSADLPEPVPAPQPAELAQFHQTHIERYTLPEGKRIQYALITPEMILDTVEIDEAVLREEYDRRRSEFVLPERRLVERLVFPDAATADAAMARLDAGEVGFADLVIERGLTLEDADMGDVTRDRLGAAGEAVFALDGPGVTGPHATPLGPAIFRMNGILAARETSFEAARPELREELAADQAARVLARQLDDFEDLLAGGATVAQLAAETEMEGGQLDWRGAATPREGINAYAEFRDAASALQQDDFAEVLLLDNGGLFAVEYLEPLDALPQPLDAVRAQVARDWQEAETEARLSELADTIEAELSATSRLSDLGRGARVLDGTMRTDRVPGLPDDVVTLGFDLASEGDVARLATGGQVHLLQLTAIAPPDPDDPATARLRDALEAQLAQGLSQDVFAYFGQGLQDGLTIRLNESVIQAVHNQLQ